MEIHNRLCEESFGYTKEKLTLPEREKELIDLYDISEYCKNIKEKIEYNAGTFYSQSAEEGLSIADWLYSLGKPEEIEIKQLLGRMIEQMWKDGTPESGEPEILCSLGKHDGTAYHMESYLGERRQILENITDVVVYAEIMPSCFANSIFADDIGVEMEKIPEFALHTEELTRNLSVLNDEALEIYYRNNKDANLAMKELEGKLLACRPDFNHQKELQYEFSYEVEEDGEIVKKRKKITCHPHLKLIRKDSDYRIYFAWKDEDVGKNEKILVGRIGSHGWKKRR